MTQNEAQEIISATFGTEAIAIGNDGNSIFWIFSNESEDCYKVFIVES